MRRSSTRMPQARGFSLIELMVTVAVVSILAAIALPSYTDYLRRGSIEEAVVALGAGQVVAEQFFLDNRTYAAMPCPGSTKKFAITCASDATTYTITATGSGSLANFVYTTNQSGARTTTSPWGNGSCWIARKGDSC